MGSSARPLALRKLIVLNDAELERSFDASGRTEVRARVQALPQDDLEERRVPG
ncbi:hypothetical protein [Streptomyces sp. NPDC054838]